MSEEGKKEFDEKKPKLFEEIAKKAEAKNERDKQIQEGKKEFDEKKPQLFKEIAEKVKEKDEKK